MKTVLIVDDKNDIRMLISDILRDEGYSTVEASTIEGTLVAISSNKVDLVILDIWLEGHYMDGIGLLKRIKKDHEKLPIIMISGHATPETAVFAIKYGAYDFIEKPFKSEKLILTVRRAIESVSLFQSIDRSKDDDFLENAGFPSSFKKVPRVSSKVSEIEEISKFSGNVFITGEIGTDKASVARYIHLKSKRSYSNFIYFDTFLKDREQIEKMLLDLDNENHSSCFINEITNIPIDLQKKMLSMINRWNDESHTVSTASILNNDLFITPRLISSTSQNIESVLKKGLLDRSLYSRLSIYKIHLLPLRERKDDIRSLADYFVRKFSHNLNFKNPEISEEVYKIFMMYDWYCNMLEFRTVVQSLVIDAFLSGKSLINVEMLPPNILEKVSESYDFFKDYKNIKFSDNNLNNNNHLNNKYKIAKDDFDRRFLSKHLKNFNWNVLKTADFLELDRTVLHRKIKKLNIRMNVDEDIEMNGEKDEQEI